MPPRKTRASKRAEAEEKVELTESTPVVAADVDAAEEGKSEITTVDEKKPERQSTKDVVVEEKEDEEASHEDKGAVVADVEESTKGDAKQTMEDRMAKMKELRKKMADSSMANRRAVATELNKHKQNAKHQVSLQRKMDKAEKVLDKRDAIENGEDWERSKAWSYSIEENEKWEEKLEKKEEGKDRGAIDPDSAAERSYRRQVKQLKPDMKAYAMQRSKPAGTTMASPSSSSSSSLITTTGSGNNSSSQVIRRNDLLSQDNATFSYGEHKPDDAALDRVSSHLNSEAVLRTKHSRKRADDADAEVNYINDKNKHYNKKIARFYDKYTTEIRENFERGTAL